MNELIGDFDSGINDAVLNELVGEISIPPRVIVVGENHARMAEILRLVECVNREGVVVFVEVVEEVKHPERDWVKLIAYEDMPEPQQEAYCPDPIPKKRKDRYKSQNWNF